MVDADDVAFKTVGGGAYPGYVPVVDYSLCDGDVCPAQGEEREEKDRKSVV